MERARRLAWPLVYAAMALVVAGPLLAPGYVFALDHAMGPNGDEHYATYVAHNEDPIQNKGAYAVLLALLGAIAPAWLAQKLVLFVPFFLAGYGAHRLVAGRASAPAALFAGLLYALSPFAYVRGVAGQTGVLWAFALAPWFLRAWLDHVETGSRRALAVATLLVALTLVFQAHGAVILALLVLVHTLVRLARAPRAWRSTMRAPLALAAWSLLLNACWLVPVALANETTLTHIGPADRDVFATTAAGLPSVGFAALTLQGFWREAYASPYATAGLLAVPAAVLVLAIHGLRSRRDEPAVALAAAGALGWLLAVASSARWTAWATEPIWENVPGLRGFRDAHKFLALLALAYAYLAPVGFDAFVAALRAAPRIPRALPVAAAALLLAAPVAGATPLLGGYGGQLGVADYPDEWAEVEARTRDCDGAMLVLPWHLYVDLSWLPNDDRRVTNPAKLYFRCPTISSDRIELGDATSQLSSPVAAYVDHWMVDAGFATGNPRNITHLGNLLSPAGVRYALVLKESDWRIVAGALDAQEDLVLVLDNDRVRLYESRADLPPPLRSVEATVALGSIDELLPLANSTPLARVAFTVGAEGPVSVAAVYTPPPRAPATTWRLGDDAPATTSLGFAPAFEAASTEAVRDEGKEMGVLAWILSGLGLVALAIWAAREERRITRR